MVCKGHRRSDVGGSLRRRNHRWNVPRRVVGAGHLTAQRLRVPLRWQGDPVKVIYIAGKYRGPNAWAIEQNIRAAEEVAARVWAMGMVALCPHANSRHMDGVATDEVFLDGTMELLRRCDAVVLVP